MMYVLNDDVMMKDIIRSVLKGSSLQNLAIGDENSAIELKNLAIEL